MNFGEAINSGFRNYFSFRGRSSRSAFWWWQLFVVICAAGLSVVDAELFGSTNDAGPLNSVFNLIVLIPSLALSVRRLHDTDRSGWWMFIIFIPLAGIIALIVWWCQRTQLGPNRFGAMPVDFYRQSARGEPEF